MGCKPDQKKQLLLLRPGFRNFLKILEETLRLMYLTFNKIYVLHKSNIYHILPFITW